MKTAQTFKLHFLQKIPLCKYKLFPAIVLEHCREGKPTVGSPFFVAFSSDRNPKVTTDVSVHFFTNSSNSCKLYQRIPGNF